MIADFEMSSSIGSTLFVIPPPPIPNTTTESLVFGECSVANPTQVTLLSKSKSTVISTSPESPVEETTGKIKNAKPKKRRKKTETEDEDPEEEVTGKVITGKSTSTKKEKRSATTTKENPGMDQTKDESSSSTITTASTNTKRPPTNWKEQCTEYRHRLEKRELELQNALQNIETLKSQLNETRQQLMQTQYELRETQKYDREHREFVRTQFEKQTTLLSILNHDLTSAHAGHVNTLKDQRHHQAATATLLIQQQMKMMEDHRNSLKQKQLIPEQLLLLPPEAVLEEIDKKDSTDATSQVNVAIDAFHKEIFTRGPGQNQDLGKAIDHYQKMSIELVHLEQQHSEHQAEFMKETNPEIRKQKQIVLSDMRKNIQLINRSVQRLRKQLEPYVKEQQGEARWKQALEAIRQASSEVVLIQTKK